MNAIAPGAAKQSNKSFFAGLWWLAPVAGVPLLFALPFFAGQVFLFRDLLYYVVPQQEFAARAIAAGHLPQWNPLLYGGAPFFAEPDTGAFHPGNLVFQLLPGARAATLFVLLHLPLAAAGTLLLARALGLSRLPAALAAIAYTTAGYVLSMHACHVYFASAAVLPLAVAALVRLADAPSPGRAVAASAVMAGLVFNGDLQAPIFAGVLAAALVLASRPRLRGLLLLCAAGVLGGLLAFVQLWPALLFARGTVRAQGIPLGEASTWALHPLRWLELLVPQPFGISYPENGFWGASLIDSIHPVPWAPSLYMGPIVVLLALATWRSAGRTRALWAVFALALLLAGGAHFPFFALWHRWVPFANRFRYPEKFAALATLVLALLAGRALEERKLPLPLFVAAGLAFLIAALGAAAQPAPLLAFIDAGLQRGGATATSAQAAHALAAALLHAALLCGGAALALRFAPSRAGLILFALISIDGLYAGRALLSFGDGSFLAEPSPAAAQLSAALPSGSAGRFYRDRSCRFPGGGEGTLLERQRRWEWRTGKENFPALLGLPDALGYGAAESKEKVEAWQHAGASGILRAARLFGAAAVLGCTQSGEPTVTKVPEPLPRLFFAEAEERGPREQILARLASFDPGKIALLEDSTTQVVRFPAAERAAELSLDAPEQVVLHARGAGGLLVLADSFAPGWTATIDGASIEVRQVDLLYRGLEVPAGAHELRFQYQTPGLRAGALISMLALLGCAALLFFGELARRQRSVISSTVRQ